MHGIKDNARRIRPLLVAWCLALLVAVLPFAAYGAPLFSDDFEDGNATGWTTNGGSWSVVTDGSRVYRQGGTSSDARALAGSTWTDQVVEARVKPISFNGTNRFVAVLARAQNATNYYYLALRNNNTIELKKLVSGSSTTLASGSFTVSTGTWYSVKLEVVGSTLRGYVNGVQLLTATDTRFTSGKIGVATFYASAAFDDVVVNAPGGGGTATPTSTATATRTATRTPTPGTPTITPTPSRTPTPGPAPSGPIGFASVNALGQNGTTGGAGGTEVTVTTASQFLDYIARPEPYIIRVSGMISLPGPMHDVKSNKSIFGIGANSGITGGGLNIGDLIDDDITSPPATAIKNIIIRNMRITNCPDDCINIQMFAHHIWVDHNDLSQQTDGALDIKRGADYVTVSWNNFHDSDKNSLVGHDDSNGPQDIGRLRVTYHHNWFNGSNQRNPRVRFAEPLHIFNNYYLNITGYGAASQMNAGLMVENNYFDNVEKPTRNDVGGSAGRIVARGNINVNTEDPIVTAGSVVEPSTYYSYTLDNAADIPAKVSSGAGVGKINP
jgi:pectate lyase